MQQSEISEWIATVNLASKKQCLQGNAKGQRTDIPPSYEQNALLVLAQAAEMRQLEGIGTVDLKTRNH